MTSKLLIDTYPLVIIPELAEIIGLNESIILQQIHYWLEINKKADRNFKEGYHWTFNSYESWQEQFPFWSIETIKRTITKLERFKLLITENFNRVGFDRTKWYRIDYNALESLCLSPLGQNDPIDEVKMTPPIPETIQRESIPENELGILTIVADLVGKSGWLVPKGKLRLKSSRKLAMERKALRQ